MIDSLLRHADERRIQDAITREFDALARQQRTYTNPRLAIEHERQNAQEGEWSYRLSQPLDLTGRRDRMGDSVARQGQARLENRRMQHLGRLLEARQHYADWLWQQHRLEALERWKSRVIASSNIVRERVRQGDASGFDLRRLQQELQAATSRASQAGSDLQWAHTRIQALLPTAPDASPTPEGFLLPPEPPSLAVLESQAGQRPDLKSLNAEREALLLESSTLKRQWLSGLEVSVGVKRTTSAAGPDEGLMLGFSLPLPVTGQTAARQLELQAGADKLQLEQARQEHTAKTLLKGRWDQQAALRREAVRARQEAVDNARALSRIAETAYHGGEVSVLELLDAYRTELAAELDTLELEYRTRLTCIELDYLAGVTP